MINWQMNGKEIEQESFRRIESEINKNQFPPNVWPIIRRLIHTTADFSIAKDVCLKNDPISATHKAIKQGANIYCDSNMIKNGISLTKINKYGGSYTRESILCHIADPDVAISAKEKHTTRAIASLKKAKEKLNDAIILIGNAPLALAGLSKMILEENIKPAIVIGMPVGFVHVVESKEMIMQTDIPQVIIKGRRGGSPLAVASLHAMLE